MRDLLKIYDDIRIVNKRFFQRLADLDIEDATLNALVKLDLFAQHVSISVDRDVLDEIENLFSAYFE